MRNRNGDCIERRRLKVKPHKNRHNLKHRKSNVYKVEKSASRLKCPRKTPAPRKPKNNKIFSRPEPTGKLSTRNAENGCEVGDMQPPQENGETDYVIHIEQECILNFNSYSRLSLDNVAGLDEVKQVIKECWILPTKRPDLFKGLRYPVRGILLFGASGTGKTILGKCIASEMRSTFLNVSPSTLASKWMGETEKLIRALFAVAKFRQPSIMFIDNIECILSPSNPQDDGTMRGIVNEFLVQMDNINMKEDERILILGTTKRPQDLSEAARRRFEGRKKLLTMLLEKENHCLEEKDMNDLARRTKGYSGADLKLLCQDAAMGPIRFITEKDILKIQASKVRPIIKEDFHHALSCIKPSITKKEMKMLTDWNKYFGHKCSVPRKPPSC